MTAPRMATPIPDPPAGLMAVRPSDWLPIWRMVRVQPQVDVKPWADGPTVRITAAVKTAGLWAYTYADYADGTHVYPGRYLLALVAGMSERTAGAAMVSVCQLGFMWQYVNGSRQGRRAIASEYRLTVPDDLFDRIPLLDPDEIRAASPASDQVTPDQVIPHHVMPDQVISEHVISATGSGELRRRNRGTEFTPPRQDLVTHPDTPQIPLLTSAGVEGNHPAPWAVDNPDDGRPLDLEAERRRQSDALMAFERTHPEAR